MIGELVTAIIGIGLALGFLVGIGALIIWFVRAINNMDAER